MLLQLFKTAIHEHRYMFSELKKNHKKELKKILKKNKQKSLTIDDEKNWINKLNRLTYSNPKLFEVAKAFSNNDITIVKNRKVYPTDIIAICVTKNDLTKLKKFISHHRSLGIDKFVILDNNSTDGTISYLLKQKDVIIYETKTPYSSFRRLGWINRIISHFGYDRWYFVGDSDELLVYNECENKTIKDIIDYCKKSKITRLNAIMLDMYAKEEYYEKGKMESYYKECIYFDNNTYYMERHAFFDCITGGPRERIFNVKTSLTKYPLFYFQKKDVFRSHYLYPYYKNFDVESNLVLKHYKFLPGELEKYEKIAKDGNYYNGSIEYKNYLKVIKKNRLNFMCDNTIKYKDSNSLDSIPMYKKIKW